MSKTGGISTLQIFLFCFVFAKLAGWIDWSWFWVLAPLWIPLAFVALCFLVAGVCTVLLWMLDDSGARRRRKARKRLAAQRRKRLAARRPE